MPTVRTDELEIAYRDDGPRDGPALLLLHGWPDDATTWDRIIPALNGAGLRTVTPFLRGFGPTRLLSATGPRTADTGILALDAMALLDALGIDRFSVAGHDWGSNIAEALAAGWPDRVLRIAMLSSPSRLGDAPTPDFAQARRYWYHWFQATERGAEAVRRDPHGFARAMWTDWSPSGWFDDDTFRQVAVSFDNPDWVAVTLHSYRARWGEAEPDPRGAWLENRVRHTERFAVPTVFFEGEADGVTPPAMSENMANKFSGPFRRVTLPGIGHFPTREAPDAIAHGLIAHLADGGA